jgi:hypothetical protein
MSSGNTSPKAGRLKGCKATPQKQVGPELLLHSVVQNAVAMELWGKWAGEPDLPELIVGLAKQSESIKAGDLSSVEEMLYGQAVALQTIFTSLTRRSAQNAGEFMDAADKYMRLALKAQSQCRATLETLAIIKNPQPYIKQANISQGPQQVNNSFGKAPQTQTEASREKFQNEPNKLLEHQHAIILDTRAQGQAGRTDTSLEAVEQVLWSKVAQG